MVCVAVASCACMYVKAARVAAGKGGDVELRQWGVKWGLFVGWLLNVPATR